VIVGGQPWRKPDEFVPEGWTPYTEADKVQEWRAEQLRRAGANDALAAALARTKGDLHKMCDAVKAGTAPETLLSVFA
jgi:hypothetical protein